MTGLTWTQVIEDLDNALKEELRKQEKKVCLLQLSTYRYICTNVLGS